MQDERLARVAQGGNLVAVNAKYHKSCYRNATRENTLQSITMQAEKSFATHDAGPDLAESAQGRFFSIVEERIIYGGGILRMTDLCELLRKITIDKGESEESSVLRPDKLKSSLMKRFGDRLDFLQSKSRHRSTLFVINRRQSW